MCWLLQAKPLSMRSSASRVVVVLTRSSPVESCCMTVSLSAATSALMASLVSFRVAPEGNLNVTVRLFWSAILT